MDMKGVNPFLFTEEEYVSPNSGNSNPFLMGGDDFMDDCGGNENPFLSQTATTVAASTTVTNPFAFDPMDLGPSEAQPAAYEYNTFIEPTAQATTNVFTEAVTVSQDFLIDTTVNIPTITPQKPTDLDLKYTNSVETNGVQPKRPPPPRPPPSKETQDLFMSVMGEMDATSSHLLDRIPPTRTPSPVSMRDLHSPSPTPEPTFGDLLDVSDAHTENDLMSLSQETDINQNPPVVEQPPVQLPPSRPVPPVRPPRPAPPQKPPPPIFAQPQPTQISAPAPKPPSFATTIPTTTQNDEMLDMFGVEPTHLPKSNADIMNLYNKEVPVDLLSDLLEPSKKEIAEAIASETNSRKSSAHSFENNTIPVQTNESSPQQLAQDYLSPQADTQMDTSDSQSKESLSSVTFNPFAAVEETSPTNPSVMPSQDFSNNVNNYDNIIPIDSNSEIIEHPLPEIDDNLYQSNNMFENETTNQSKSNESFEIRSTARDTFGMESDTFVSNTFENVSNTFENVTNTFESNTNSFGNIREDAVSENNTYETSAFGINEAKASAFGDNNAFGNTDSISFGATQNTFGSTAASDIFGTVTDAFVAAPSDAFDAFTAKFESARDENKNGAAFDAFSDGGNAWGGGSSGFTDSSGGFGTDGGFDEFLAMKEPPVAPQSTPNRFNKSGSLDSDEEKDFSVVIRPKAMESDFGGVLPVLAPPPIPVLTAFSDASRINPFDQSESVIPAVVPQDFPTAFAGNEMKRSESQESPATPLFDEDTSQPLEPFPRLEFKEEGWEMQLRQPNKKKITGQRFWKKIFVKLVYQQDCVLLQLYNQQSDKDPFQELPLQPCYSVSDIGAQQYDNFGKIFTVKLQYIFYKERPGVRPGQVKKAERITNKLSQFAAYAIQGDYQGCKEFGSDLKKLGLPVEHAPQVSQLMKLGSLSYEDLKQFSVSIEEALFKLQAHRDRALHYKMEEVQVTAVDELYVQQDSEGHIEKQIARVRLFFLGFLTGMPDIELGVNDMRRQGKEVVGRHDIIPVVTEEWIRLENVEFHSCVQQLEYNDTRIIKFKPPDACYIELLRFRVRPPKNRELPLQLKAQICVTGTKIELRADVLVPGFASRKLGQVPCEDVMIKFPIPECWIYMFRVEKHFRYGSVKSAHRRTGKIKGIERILGTVDTLQESLIEVTSGQAKYEHQHRAIVWRCPRLPKEGQGAYTTHNMVCRLSLTSYDQMPDQLAEYAYVEFTMPATQVSHTTVRSVSLQNSDSDEPPEKYVRYLARHEYRVGIEHTEGEGPAAYVAATHVSKPAVIQEEKPKPIPEAESSSDSD